MFTDHLQHALTQVRELHARVVENQHFCGYSATARALGAAAALVAAIVMALPVFPTANRYHLWGWALVCALAAGANYGALALWYLKQPADKRELALLRPTIDAFPPLIVGGILTCGLIQQEAWQLLFGTWMCIFGLVNLSARRVLSKEICWLGWYYIACGTFCLGAASVLPFANPWPMGLVFFAGELFGSRIFARQRTQPELD